MTRELRIQDIEVRCQQVERLLRLASTIFHDAHEALDTPRRECVEECLLDGLVLVDVTLELFAPILTHLGALGEGKSL